MKTKQEVSKEISELEAKGANKKLFKPSEYTALCSRVAFLRSVSNYLESEPRQEFVEKQLQDLQNKVKLIGEGFQEFLDCRPKDNKDNKQIKAEYNSQMGLNHINKQIKILNYILY